MLKVELLFISSDSTFHHHLTLEDGASVMDAVHASKLWVLYPETKDLSYGIFSKPVSLETELKSGDRIEVYRPLISSPKEKRRQRAKGSSKPK